MALTKLRKIKSTLNIAIDYVKNTEKTTLNKAIDYAKNTEKTTLNLANTDNDNVILVSAFECNIENATFDFTVVKDIAKQVKGDYSKVGGCDILAWEIIQSFSPEDNVTPEQVHELGKELAKRFLNDEYQYLVSTHLDKNHLHNHITFNSVSFKTLKKFDEKRNIEHLRVRKISNEICKENNLSILEYPNQRINKKQKFIEADISKKDKSFKSVLKNDIDTVLKSSINFTNFIDRMKNLGYEIIEDKNGLGFKSNNQKYYTRLKNLGENYSKDYLLEAIKNNKSLKAKLEKTPIRNDSFTPIDIEDLLQPKDVLNSNISWRAKLKYCIDYYIFKSNNFDEFLKNMQDIGYSIKYGKHIAFRCAGMDKNIRAKVLGESYTEESIKERILENNKPFPKVPFITQNKEIKLENSIDKSKVSIKKLIPIYNNDKYQSEIYYQKFVRRYNTNQMIATDNFMRRHKYTDESLELAIEKLKKEIFLDIKELANIEKDFENLSKIKRTTQNSKDIDEAFSNLKEIKMKVSYRIQKNKGILVEHKVVQENLKIYEKNKKINKSH